MVDSFLISRYDSIYTFPDIMEKRNVIIRTGNLPVNPVSAITLILRILLITFCSIRSVTTGPKTRDI